MKKVITSLSKPAIKLHSRFYREKNSLIIFLFHSLFHNEKEIELNLVDPQSRITINYFRRFVEYFLNNSYKFISPEDIVNALNTDKKYILVTFDDGYFNNQNVLPILREYRIPALFNISTNHVKYFKCFWWDVLWRKIIDKGMVIKDIQCIYQELKSKTNEDIEKYLIYRFGENALKPIGDFDRPFTSSELKDFSKEKYVFLGNHSNDHAILTNYSTDEIRTQILDAQNDIYNITGITPIIISYPNGNYSKEIVRISREIGLKFGVTIYPKKNYLPIDCQGNESMQLGRFTLNGNVELIKQCEIFRSDLYTWVKKNVFLCRNYK